jgi:hypothetical protein
MDRLFLQLIRRQPDLAPCLFMAMAERLRPEQLVAFLGDQAQWRDAMSVIGALPKAPFLVEVGRQLVGRRL